MKWRKTIRALHRDVGYLAVALTVIYAISGIAVNHINDWNPNYIIDRTTATFEPVDSAVAVDSALAVSIAALVGVEDEIASFFRPDPETFDIFFESATISAKPFEGTAEVEQVKSRPVFRETNYLHLNHPKKLWTWVADLFAVALAFLAITGLFMIKGKNGIKGRGAWMTAIGVLIPVVFWLIYYV